MASVERVAHESIDQMPYVGIKNSRHELLSQKVELTLRKVKQRTDVGVVLPVVVAERSFVVAEELGDTIVCAHLPALGHGLVDFELDRAVLAHRVYEAIGNAGCSRRRRDLIAAGIKGIWDAERIVAVGQNNRIAIAVVRRSRPGECRSLC